ncbi:hypothetical protein DQ353_12815 [Arthrobacter sp. AQ5-05]|uniref:hypothetical protein n=1 Tax=Arthrobacter sp. AQ5-05 TaxID=2184581 RepID=UPI000DCECBA9|nr:hypothetical protein [Arthrobacter sp. AQ5-05]RAX48810.1 hypothetical protein DQ353_12815 [Arthrobacter sp. AQ5-05]
MFARNRFVAVVLAGAFAIAWYGLFQAPDMGLVSAIVGPEASEGSGLSTAGFLRLAAGMLAFTALPATAYALWLRLAEPEGIAGRRTAGFYLGAFLGHRVAGVPCRGLAGQQHHFRGTEGSLPGLRLGRARGGRGGQAVGDALYGAAIATALLLALGFIRAMTTPPASRDAGTSPPEAWVRRPGGWARLPVPAVAAGLLVAAAPCRA